MAYQLKDLRITREHDWRENSFKYDGKIRFEGETCDITLRIDDAFCRKIIDLAAENIVEVANETAKLMKAEIIEQTKLLEVKP